MSDAGDVRLQLNDLEAEEARIMRELREMDEKAHAETEANRKRAEQYKENPEAALTSLLLECEKEVRDAKGYIADQGPPLRIVRLRHGETGPKSATYLSRPRNTGVDFTVPVTLKAYIDLIKHPIFLNQIRDKIKQHKYSSTAEYLDDMKLLLRNTAQFNKGPDLAWVVQHARFLLEAAEDAVASRRLLFREVEEALRQRNAQKLTRQSQSSLSAVGKRKRAHVQDKTNGDISAIPAVGSAIEIYWPSYRKWYLAYITAHGEGGSCHLRYDEDNSLQWVTLDHERWRMRNSRFTGAARGKRAHEQPAKRRKSASTASPTTTDQPVYVSGGITPEDLDAIKIDLFAKFDDLRDSIVEQLKDHLSRIDRAIIRSDALSRVLIQVEDTQAKVEAATESMQKRFDSLEERVTESLKPTGLHQDDTIPTSKLDKGSDNKKDAGSDAADPTEREGSNDLVREGQPDSAQDRMGDDFPSAGPVQKDRNLGSPLEKDPATTGVDHDKEGGIKVSQSATIQEEVDDKQPTDPVRELSIDNSARKKSPKVGREIDEDLGREQEPYTSEKVDTEMVDVADVEEGTKNDGGSSPKEDKSEADDQVKPDTKAHASRRNWRIRDDPIDLEADNNVEATKGENEESVDSNESGDSESDDSNVHKGVAEKKPATMRAPERAPEVEGNEPAEPQRTEEQRREVSDEHTPEGTRAEHDVNEGIDKGIDGEQDKPDTRAATEGQSEEIGTVALSAKGSDAREQKKDHSSTSREPKAIQDDVGD